MELFAIPSILWVSNRGNELLQGATHKEEISLIKFEAKM